MVGHQAAVRCVQYDGRLVVSGAYDYMVKVWNPETEECLHTLQGHTNRVYSLQVFKKKKKESVIDIYKISNDYYSKRFDLFVEFQFFKKKLSNSI